LSPFCLALSPFGAIITQGEAADTFSSAKVSVHFSPKGGATETVVQEISHAKSQILVQAYSFTSAPIAKALIDASKRGVKIHAVLDKSNETQKYSAATFLFNAGIETQIDDQHAIAHNKIIIIDNTTVITGSFNFTKAAEERNAENLLVLKDAPDLVILYKEHFQNHAMHAHPYTPGEVSVKNTKKR
jgi:phosphatidylserine/phosphatidylglycerophosphate/cardiolipin synthase-like enzyme